ncbi:MAG TPA: glycoside hydrolase family 6 protein [Jatrophihabitantaceae bacterium]|nr:glycoside hydrolase family 6 protein [Jatrophihabitantaceae bacterium]
MFSRRILFAATGAAALTVSLVAGLTGSAPERAEAAIATATSSDYTLAGGPFAGRALYVDPHSTAADAAAAAGGTNTTLNRLASIPQATWLVGGTPAQAAGIVRTEVGAASRSGAVTEFVVYDLPNRDCSGGQSAGGAAENTAYQNYVSAVSAALKGARGIVVLEPDALADLGCLTPTAQTSRLALLKWAVRRLVQPGVQVYLDAGHAGWQTSSTMAYRLIKAGIYYARGFSVNVSSFDATSSEIAYGTKISSQVGWKRFVVDTSRNGSPTSGGWCNPAGATTGALPGTDTGTRAADALLWIKHPGESDGACGTSTTTAGGFDTGLATALAG